MWKTTEYRGVSFWDAMPLVAFLRGRKLDRRDAVSQNDAAKFTGGAADGENAEMDE